MLPSGRLTAVSSLPEPWTIPVEEWGSFSSGSPIARRRSLVGVALDPDAGIAQVGEQARGRRLGAG
jgi:hypothetical protein